MILPDNIVCDLAFSSVTGNNTDYYGNTATGTGIVSSNVGEGSRQGVYATTLNGSDEKFDCGDIGTIRTIALVVYPVSTTEEFLLVDTGKDIMVSGGTVTYTGLTASATYVDGAVSTTMIAGQWQVLVSVLNADVDANNFEIGTDGSNFGNIIVERVMAYDTELTRMQSYFLGRELLPGRF